MQLKSNMTKKFDVLVAGEINPDLVLSGDVVPEFGQVEKLVDSASLVIGSSAAIFACAAARLGLKVSFVGICGEDIFGRFMLDEMSRHGVDVSEVRVDPKSRTGLSVILSKGNDRAILTHTGCMADLQADHVSDSMLQKCRHLHVTSYFLQTGLQAGLPDLYQRAHKLGLSTSLDTNWDPSERWMGVLGILPLVDIFLPNENEAVAITGARTIGQALKRLGQQVGTVALKRGAQGALACRGEETATAVALAGGLVDTVGAGDSFDAGFIYGYINGWELERSLWLAATCGSLSTRAAGGIAGQSTLEEAMRYVPPTG